MNTAGHPVYMQENSARETPELRRNVITCRVNTVITKQQGGRMIVVQQSRRGRRFTFDPYPSHAVAGGPPAPEMLNSGSWALLMNFKLKDGVYYVYPVTIVDTFEDALALGNTWLAYRDDDARLYGFGEWWNRYGRSMVLTKLDDVGWLAWRDSH